MTMIIFSPTGRRRWSGRRAVQCNNITSNAHNGKEKPRDNFQMLQTFFFLFFLSVLVKGPVSFHFFFLNLVGRHRRIKKKKKWTKFSSCVVRDEKKKNGEGAVGLGPREMTALGCYIRGVKITLKRKKPGRGKRPPKATHTHQAQPPSCCLLYTSSSPLFFSFKKELLIFLLLDLYRPTLGAIFFLVLLHRKKEKFLFIYFFGLKHEGGGEEGT